MPRHHLERWPPGEARGATLRPCHVLIGVERGDDLAADENGRRDHLAARTHFRKSRRGSGCGTVGRDRTFGADGLTEDPAVCQRRFERAGTFEIGTESNEPPSSELAFAHE